MSNCNTVGHVLRWAADEITWRQGSQHSEMLEKTYYTWDWFSFLWLKPIMKLESPSSVPALWSCPVPSERTLLQTRQAQICDLFLHMAAMAIPAGVRRWPWARSVRFVLPPKQCAWVCWSFLSPSPLPSNLTLTSPGSLYNLPMTLSSISAPQWVFIYGPHIYPSNINQL